MTKVVYLLETSSLSCNRGFAGENARNRAVFGAKKVEKVKKKKMKKMKVKWVARASKGYLYPALVSQNATFSPCT